MLCYAAYKVLLHHRSYMANHRPEPKKRITPTYHIRSPAPGIPGTNLLSNAEHGPIPRGTSFWQKKIDTRRGSRLADPQSQPVCMDGLTVHCGARCMCHQGESGGEGGENGRQKRERGDEKDEEWG